MSWCQGQVVLVQDHNRERGLVGVAKPRLPEAGQPLSAPGESLLPSLGLGQGKWKKDIHPCRTELTIDHLQVDSIRQVR